MKEQDEKLLRRIAFNKHGKTKGAISKTIKEAIVNLDEKEEAYIEIARKGLHLGKIDMKNLRKNIYERDYRI